MANDNDKTRNPNVTGSTTSKDTNTDYQKNQNEPNRNTGQDSGFSSGSGRSGQPDIDRNDMGSSGKMGQTGSRHDQELDRDKSNRDVGNKGNL
jgi:hypothetical protein